MFFLLQKKNPFFLNIIIFNLRGYIYTNLSYFKLCKYLILCVRGKIGGGYERGELITFFNLSSV